MSNKPYKIIKRENTTNVHENQEISQDYSAVDPNCPQRIVCGSTDIVIDRKIDYIFTPNSYNYDSVFTHLLTANHHWHLITVHHKGAFTKTEKQLALDELVNNNPLIAVKYRCGNDEDNFFIYNQPEALNSMLQNNLQTTVENRRLSLTVKLAVANYLKSHINPLISLENAIQEIINQFREVTRTLNFSHFGRYSKHMSDLTFSMSNKGNFELFCDRVMKLLSEEKHQNVIKNLRILSLVGNNIRYLGPMTYFVRCRNIENVSLKNNLIISLEELEHIQPLKLKTLNIMGNPFTTSENALDEIMRMLNTLEKVDLQRFKPELGQDPIASTSTARNEKITTNADIFSAPQLSCAQKPTKIRRRDYTKDFVNDQDFSVDFEKLEPNQVVRVKFNSNLADIVLDRKVSYIFMPGNCKIDSIASSLLASPDFWHSVLVHHQGAFAKEEIQRGLNELANNIALIGVKYCSGKNEDTFYVHNQPVTLLNLLQKNLQTVIGNRRLSLTLKLAVATYHSAQIDTISQIDQAIEDIISRFREQIRSLDFSRFNANKFLMDINFSLSNKGNFELFCDRLLRNLFREKYKNVTNNLNILVLVKNDIKFLEPLSRFVRCKNIQNISLKNNLIEAIHEFEHLKPLKLKILTVAGNPVAAKNDKLGDEIVKILDTLEKLDIRKVTLTELKEQPKEVPEPEVTLSEEIITTNDINEKFKRQFHKKEYAKAHWSEVFIEHNGKFNGMKVLDEMFRALFNETACYPCFYKSGELEDSFMLINNFEPLKILVKNDLRIRMPGTDQYVTFCIILKSSHAKPTDIKPSEAISRAVDRRLNGKKLDLSHFHEDPELRNVIVNMTCLAVKKYVTYLAVNKNLKIMSIDLSHNNITSLYGFEMMNRLNDLICLDFSHNKISSLQGFPVNLQILEISFNNNPLCDTYKTTSTPYKYVSTLRMLCSKLEFIDGRKIDKDFKLVHLHNYFESTAAYPAIENFIDYFFTNFDIHQSRWNQLVDSLYGNDCILMESQTKFTAIGTAQIKDYYRSFPYTEHDFITMTVDTPIFSNSKILIVVNGVFKQKGYSMNEVDKLLTFSRMFLLKNKRRIKNGRAPGTLSDTFNFEITNEIFTFDTLTDHKIKNKAFKKQRAKEIDIERAFDGKHAPKEKFVANLELFRQITCLKDEWCTRMLEDANGNTSLAVQNFLKFCKLGIIRKEDFILNF